MMCAVRGGVRQGAPRRGAGIATLAALASLAAGCQEAGENALLLEVRSPTQLANLSVTVKQYFSDGSTEVSPEFPTKLAASARGYVGAAGGDPLRLNVELPAPGRCAVHLVGEPVDAGEPLVVATICREVVGVQLVTGLWLGRLPGELDTDGDTFPEDAAAFCALQTSEEIACEESCNSAEYAAMADCNPDETVPLAPECAGYGRPEEWNPFVSPDPCGDCHDQDCWRGDRPCEDRDGDGYASNVDCNDDDPAINPGAEDICGNGLDENCRQDFVECVDRDMPCDADGDGFAGEVLGVDGCGNDCDDTDPDVHPGAYEGCGADPANPDACPGCPPEDPDRDDDDCDGSIDEGCFADDLDDDGTPYPADCDDCNLGVNPNATERCGNSADEDCSGADLPCGGTDQDGDGFVAEGAGGNDCDDSDPHVHPGAPDRCGDGIAQDCMIDQPCDAITDGDGDGFGLRQGDCDDADAHANPWEREVCDAGGVDEDCDGLVNEVDGPDALDHGCVRDEATLLWTQIDYGTNIDHCGECRHRCCADACDCRGDACTSGACTCHGAAECAGGVASFCCPEVGCRDLGTDVENCGGCGVRCVDGEVCRPTGACGLGQCVCEAGPVAEACTGEPGSACCPGPGCTNLLSDARNCGSCGVDCTASAGGGPRGDACIVGSAGLGVCSCGATGMPCASPTWCTEVTDPGASCGCADLRWDRANCGACGVRCGDSQVCCDGACYDGSCCTDEDCWSDQNPDCDPDDHECYCRAAGGRCGGWDVCCSYGCAWWFCVD
jgi:hypothetical protein